MDNIDREVALLQKKERNRYFLAKGLNLDGSLDCLSCGRLVGEASHLFCIWCGHKNEKVDEIVFSSHFGTLDFDEARRQHCEREHVENEECFLTDNPSKEDLVNHNFYRYCKLCGKDCMPPGYAAQ